MVNSSSEFKYIFTPPARPRLNYDIQSFYTDWCRQHGLEPRGELFVAFTRAVRLSLFQRCPETLLEATAFSFGGADGGGGIVASAQGEDVPYIRERSGGVVSSVEAFSQEKFFDVLHARVVEHFPEVIVGEEPENDAPPHLLVQGEWVEQVQNRILQRPHLQRNVGGVHPLDRRRYEDLLARQHEKLPHWHVPALDNTESVG